MPTTTTDGLTTTTGPIATVVTVPRSANGIAARADCVFCHRAEFGRTTGEAISDLARHMIADHPEAVSSIIAQTISAGLPAT